MAPKPKGKPAAAKKKLTAEEEAREAALKVDDIDDDDYKKSLRIECRNLEKMIKREEDLAGLY